MGKAPRFPEREGFFVLEDVFEPLVHPIGRSLRLIFLHLENANVILNSKVFSGTTGLSSDFGIRVNIVNFEADLSSDDNWLCFPPGMGIDPRAAKFPEVL